MKRLSAVHRKTPQNKEDSCPDFVELSKTSPLPHIHFVSRGKIGERAVKSGGEKKAENSDEEKPGSPKKKAPSKSGGGSMKIVKGTFDEDGLPKTVQPSESPSVQRSSSSASLLGKRSARSMEEDTPDVCPLRSYPKAPVSSGVQSMNSFIALQRDNDALRRRIVAMEMNQKAPVVGHRYRPRGPPPSMHPGLAGGPRSHPPAPMPGNVEHRLSEISRNESELMMLRSGSAVPAAGMAMGRPGMYPGPPAGEYRHPMDHQMRAMHQGRMGGRHPVPPPHPGSHARTISQGSSGELRWNSSIDQQMMGRPAQRSRMGGRHHFPPPVVD